MPSLILIVLAITILTPSQPVFDHTPYFLVMRIESTLVFQHSQCPDDRMVKSAEL